MAKSKVPMNLIQQDVFVKVACVGNVDKNDYLVDSYVSQDELVKDNGTEIVDSVHDYPHTPEALNSYADGTNYKNDLVGAISRGPRGKNLGDVSALQEVLCKSPDEIATFFRDAAEKIAAAAKPVSSEVVDNG